MAIDRDDLIFALGKSSAIVRDLFRLTIEETAARWRCSEADIIEILAWHKQAAPRYAGTPEAVEAEALATKLRRGRQEPLAHPTERRPALEGPPGPNGRDMVDKSRPRRRCVRCGRRFQPTVKRTRMCLACWHIAAHADVPF